MLSYAPYIGGKDAEGVGWTYVVKASAYLRDSRGTFRMKRQLELGHDVEIPDDVVGRVARCNAEHSQEAVRAARAASREFRRTPLAVRAKMLNDIYYAVVAHIEEFEELLVAEGHPRRLARWEISGVLRGIDPATTEWYTKQLHQTYEFEGRTVEVVRKPDGVVCINPPQNAAGSNAVMGVLALLAGNTLVVKAPRSSPLSVMWWYRELVVPVLEQYGAPPGTVNVISGRANEVLEGWLDNPDVDDVLFFGDSVAGLRLEDECIKRGKKPILELAGNDGFVVWHDADLDAAARALIESFYGSSQICMVPKYAVVHPAVAEEFLAALVPLVTALKPGFPESETTLLSPVLKTDQYFDFLSEAREAGATMLCGGRRLDVHGEEAADGVFLEPTVIRVDGLADSRKLSAVREETFFPLLPVVVPDAGDPIDDDEQLLATVIDFLDANEYGLRNSLWTVSREVADEVATSLGNGGMLKINDSHIGFTSYLSTHGGTGKTGGVFGEMNYLGLRTSHVQGISWGTGDPQPLDKLVMG